MRKSRPKTKFLYAARRIVLKWVVSQFEFWVVEAVWCPAKNQTRKANFLRGGVDFSVHDQSKKFCLIKYNAKLTHYPQATCIFLKAVYTHQTE